MSIHGSIGATDSSSSRPFTALSKFPKQVSDLGICVIQFGQRAIADGRVPIGLSKTTTEDRASKRRPPVPKGGTDHIRRHILHPEARGRTTGRASDVRWVNGNREQELNP